MAARDFWVDLVKLSAEELLSCLLFLQIPYGWGLSAMKTVGEVLYTPTFGLVALQS
jgi:hypothetical protein